MNFGCGDPGRFYIDLSDEPSVESREISDGVVLDCNAAGRLVGIDIDEASKRVQMDKLVLSQLPSTVETAAVQGPPKRITLCRNYEEEPHTG